MLGKRFRFASNIVDKTSTLHGVALMRAMQLHYCNELRANDYEIWQNAVIRHA